MAHLLKRNHWLGPVIALLLTLAAGAAFAHSARVGSVQVGHGWALPSAEGLKETMGFVPLLSEGRDDRLMAVSTPRAARVEIRRSDDRQRGVKLDTLRLAAGQPIPMRPGRLHLAFLDIDKPWVTGDRIPVTLTFEQSGPVTIDFWVEPEPYASQPKG